MQWHWINYISGFLFAMAGVNWVIRGNEPIGILHIAIGLLYYALANNQRPER